MSVQADVKGFKTPVYSYLNTTIVSVQGHGKWDVVEIAVFKYNHCVGSSKADEMRGAADKDLNTTIVSVQAISVSNWREYNAI